MPMVIREVQPAGDLDLFWYSSAISDNQLRLVAAVYPDSNPLGRIYYSSTAGYTWTELRPTGIDEDRYWYPVLMSSDGLKIAAIIQSEPGESAYYSANAGESWVTFDPEGLGNFITFCTMSRDGTKLVVSQNGRLWYSNNSGVTWLDISPVDYTLGNGYYGISISDDGLKIYLSLIYYVDELGISGQFYSTNAGSTWVSLSPSGAPDFSTSFVNISGDGTKLLCNVSNVLMFSTDSGASWSELNPGGYPAPVNWTQATLSYDGSVIYVFSANDVSSVGRVFYSTNSGSTWTEIQPAGNLDLPWWSGGMTPDALAFIAGSYPDGPPGVGRLYTSIVEVPTDFTMGTGGDFAGPKEAWDYISNLPAVPTDDITITQISDCNFINGIGAMLILGGRKVSFKNPDNYIINIESVNSPRWGGIVANGSLDISDLYFVCNGDYTASTYFLDIRLSGAGTIFYKNVTVGICDPYTATSDSAAIFCYTDDNQTIKAFNCRIYNFSRGFSLSGSENSSIFLENNAIYKCSYSGYEIFYPGNLKILNCVAFGCGSYDFHNNYGPLPLALMDRVACSDGSIEDLDISLPYGDPIWILDVNKTDFVSVVFPGANFLTIDPTSQLYNTNTGTIYIDTWNTEDIAGNPRPKEDGTVNIGIFEGVSGGIFIPPNDYFIRYHEVEISNGLVKTWNIITESRVPILQYLIDHMDDLDNPHEVSSSQLVGGMIVPAGEALYFPATGTDITSVGTLRMMKNGDDIETSRWDGSIWI